MVNVSVPGKARHAKQQSWTRRKRNRARLRLKAEQKAERLQAKAEARAFGKRYSVFFGCDPDRTEELADAERFRPHFLERLDG